MDSDTLSQTLITFVQNLNYLQQNREVSYIEKGTISDYVIVNIQ